MKIWKPLTKFRYTKDRNEWKFHTDFAVESGEKIEEFRELMEIFKEKCPKGKEWRIHFEIAIEEFDLKVENKPK